MRKTILLILFFVFVILAAAGCQQPVKRTTGKTTLANEPLVNIYYLAGRLGMTVTSSSDEKAVFKDSDNTVAIYFKEDQVYVNKSYVGPVGRTKKIDGQFNVRSSIESDIRSNLKKPIVTTVPIPAVPAPQKTTKPVLDLSGKVVVIDAGHGGKDPGAISSAGYEEKSVNLDVAMQIAQILRDRGIRVITTRSNDTFIELEERAYIANRNGADVFISIHADSSETSSKNGFTVYVARSCSSAATNLANSINNRMIQTGTSSNGVRQADYRVLTHTRCPAVLVEIGYLSNYWEAKQLKNIDTQRRLAKAIADGLTDYFNRR